MGLFSKKQKIVTHNGKFHADDIFAVATLRLITGGASTIVRTRDQAEIDSADYVVDVGAVHDPEKNRFDHHQQGGAGVRSNGIPYASFGLVWKKFGEEICGSAEVSARIDAKIASPIDADDNGVTLVESVNETTPYNFHSFLYAFRPTWKENPDMYDSSFLELVPLAEKVLRREIIIARDGLEASKKVTEAYEASTDKRLVVLDSWYPYQETLGTYSEPLYIVAPRAVDNLWKVETVRKGAYGFENRKSLPVQWAGLRDGVLAEASGVPDAVFCHNGRFLAVAKTKEGALKLAELALSAE